MFGFPLVVVCYALYFHALDVLFPLLCITFIVGPLAVAGSLTRYVKVNNLEKKIIFSDGLMSVEVIPFGVIYSIFKERGWTVVAFKDGERSATFRYAAGFYTKSNQEKILELIRETNPQVDISV